MTPEQLQAQIEHLECQIRDDYDMLEVFKEDYGENSEIVQRLFEEIFANEKELALLSGTMSQAQIIALTDTLTIPIF